MTESLEHQGAVLEFRPAPWDERSLGFPCLEFLRLQADSDEQADELLARFHAEAAARGVRLAYGRVPADSALCKRALHRAGFYYAESSYRISHRKLAASAELDALIRRGPELGLAEPQELDAIRDILVADFAHGRFHEDPWITPGQAQARYAGWLPDLVAQHHEVYAYRLKGEVIGLHIQKSRDGVGDFVLTGVKASHALLGASLWAEAMRLARGQGLREVHTLISAANLPIINLYRRLGFNFDALLTGFHRRYP
jgi:hypothetical protein